jgi:ribosome maturation factor RimP
LLNRAKLDEIIALVSRVIEPAGFECIEAEWAGSERILRLYVDRLENSAPSATASDAARQGASSGKDADAEAKKRGIDLEGCVAASRLLVEHEELDALIPGSYTLEVSSPGIERPLRSRKHFERHIGDTVQVKLADKDLPRRNGTGRLVEVSDDGEGGPRVTVETEQGPWTFPLGSLQRASLVYDWNGAGKH